MKSPEKRRKGKRAYVFFDTFQKSIYSANIQRINNKTTIYGGFILVHPTGFEPAAFRVGDNQKAVFIGLFWQNEDSLRTVFNRTDVQLNL